MIHITDYIQELDNIDQSILKHIAIEHKIYRKGNLISEQLLIEKYGIYNGLEELCEYISNIILKSNSYDNEFVFKRDDLKGIDNIFFKTLYIDIDTTEDLGAEVEDDINLDKDLLFPEVFIHIYSQVVNKKILYRYLMHELTHAYNNYIEQIKGTDRYRKASSSNYYNNIVTISQDSDEYTLKRVLYFLIGYERNAFIAQLKAELQDDETTVRKPVDSLKILQNCDIYKTYKEVDSIINTYIINRKNTIYTDKIVKIYKEIIGQPESTESPYKIFKRLQALSRKALKKLDTIIPKLCIECLNYPNYHREAFFYLTKMNS